jgi:hypothetical protein
MDGHDMLARITPGLWREQCEQIIAAQGKSFKSHYLRRVPAFRTANTLLHQSGMLGKIGLATECGSSDLAHYLHSAKVTARRFHRLW